MKDETFVEIAVPSELRDRFIAGCTHYGFKFAAGKRSVYIKVFYTPENAENLYWFGANIYGEIPETALIKRSF